MGAEWIEVSEDAVATIERAKAFENYLTGMVNIEADPDPVMPELRTRGIVSIAPLILTDEYVPCASEECSAELINSGSIEVLADEG